MRLGPSWRGGFVVGHGMDTNVLERQGSPTRTRRSWPRTATTRTSSSARCSRSGTASARSSSGCSIPRGPTFYAERGLHTVCPTQTAISVLLETVRASAPGAAGGGLMYVIVAGGGKVGANVTRSLLEMGHEVTMIEQRPRSVRAARGGVRPGASCAATRPRSACSSAQGSRVRPTSCSRSPGDDEDNLVISQIGKEGYGVREGDRARQRPAKPGRTSTCWGSGRRSARRRASSASSSTRCRSTASCACSSCRSKGWRSSRCRSRATRRSPGSRVGGSCFPTGSRLISVFRHGRTELVEPSTVMRPGRPGARGRLERLRRRAPATRSSAARSCEACLALAQSRQ